MAASLRGSSACGASVAARAVAVAGVLALALAVATPTPARAAEPPGAFLAVDAGAGVVAGDLVVGVDPLAALRLPGLSIVVGAPLRFGLDGRVRREDWDDATEVLRPLRRLSIEAGPASLEGGELRAVTFGPGVTVRGYGGQLDPDRHAAGAWGRLRTDALDVDLLADDVWTVDVVAARVALRPAAVRAPVRGSARLGVALELAADLSAAATSWTPDVDRDAPAAAGNEGVSPSARGLVAPSLAGGALSVEYLLWARGPLRLVPWLAGAALAAPGGVLGGGVHAGVRARVALGRAAGAPVLHAGAAGVLAGPSYRPGVLDALYRIERHGLPATRAHAATAPLARALADVDDVRWSVAADLRLESPFLALDVSWIGPGDGHRWDVRASLPRLGPVALALSASGRDLALLAGAAEARLQLGWFYVRTAVARGYSASEGERYEPDWTAWIGAGFAAFAAPRAR